MSVLTPSEELQVIALGLCAARCEVWAEDAFMSDRERQAYINRAQRLRDWQQMIMADPAPVYEQASRAAIDEICTDEMTPGRSIFMLWKDTLKGDA